MCGFSYFGGGLGSGCACGHWSGIGKGMRTEQGRGGSNS